VFTARSTRNRIGLQYKSQYNKKKLWPFNPKTIPLVEHPKIIPYTKLEHFGIIRFWVMLRTNRRTNRLERSNIRITLIDTKQVNAVFNMLQSFYFDKCKMSHFVGPCLHNVFQFLSELICCFITFHVYKLLLRHRRRGLLDRARSNCTIPILQLLPHHRRRSRLDTAGNCPPTL